MKMCHGCLVCRPSSRWFVVILIKTWADLLPIWVFPIVNSIKTRRLWRKSVSTLFIERQAGFISLRTDFPVDWSESVRLDYSDVCTETLEYERRWNADRKGVEGKKTCWRFGLPVSWTFAVFNWMYHRKRLWLVKSEIFSVLSQAVTDGCRIKILYQSSEGWMIRWREIDPKRVYMQQKILHHYARIVDKNEFQWKILRLSRIQQIRFTGVSVTWHPDADDGFLERQWNAFLAFLGTEKHPVSIRFTGNAAHYVLEEKWHSSQ